MCSVQSVAKALLRPPPPPPLEENTVDSIALVPEMSKLSDYLD